MSKILTLGQKELVGGDYTTELLKNHDGKFTFGVLLRGKDGMAVCGVGGENNTPTSLHPYWAQKYKRELSTEPLEQDAPVKKESLHDRLERGKERAAEQKSPVPPAGDIARRGTRPELG